MPGRYKPIGSVAHNLGHSFLSIMNYVGGGRSFAVVPREIFASAAAAGVDRVHIDVMRQRIEPEALASRPVRESLRIYARVLPRLLESQGVAPESVTSATITLELDHSRTRPAPYIAAERVPEFTCTVEMTDNRGRVHRASPTVWK